MFDEISFVIPIYNDNRHIDKTINDLYIAIERSQIRNFEVIIVDDGSDEPVSMIAGLTLPGVRILRYENQGRLRARLNGLNQSKFNQIVLLDSRVSIAENSLQNLSISHSNRVKVPAMIIAKIAFPSGTNLVGLFWDAIARLVWYRYYLDEFDVTLTEENFDTLPKGTTLLYSQKETLMYAYSCLSESELNNKDTNDDTLLIQRIVSNNEVLLSKGFLATYYPRTNLESFVKHAYHRGKVAKGGYFGFGTKGRKLFTMALGVLAFLVALGIYSTTLMMISVVVGVVCLEILFAKRIRFKHLFSLNLLAFPFLLSYGAGVIRSIFYSK
jgi:glycosyltransferase involved in cell wall biosynthesis